MITNTVDIDYKNGVENTKNQIENQDYKTDTEDSKDEKHILFDDILEDLGKFGRYQKYLYILVVLPAICSAFPVMTMVFTLGEHNHRCAVSEIRNDTYTPYGRERTILINDSYGNTVGETYSQCSITTNNTSRNVTSSKKCNSWVYDTSIFKTTLISEFDMVCDNIVLQSHASMALFGGSLFGSCTLMPLADIHGRKPVLCFCLLLMFIFSMATVWIPNYLTFITFRFIYGCVDYAYYGVPMIIDNAYIIFTFMCNYVNFEYPETAMIIRNTYTYIIHRGSYTSGWSDFHIATSLGLELVHPSRRGLAGISMSYFWCLGEFILCGLAYWLRDWRDLQLAKAIPLGLFVGYYFMIEESPRWLLAKGRDAEARVIIRKIAKYNRVTLPEETIKAVQDPIDPNKNISLKTACIPVFKSPRLLVWIAIVYFNLFVIGLGYYGITLNVGSLDGDVYLDFLVASILELVALILCHLLLNRIGRRPFHCSFMILGGISCLCSIFTVAMDTKSPAWVAITLTMIGKLGVSGAFCDIWIIEAEITPTPVRSFVMGIGGIAGQIGSMVAPYIAEINNLVRTDFGIALPLIIYGALMFAAGLMTLLLPETNNKKLPDTIEEAEDLKRSKSRYHKTFTVDSHSKITLDDRYNKNAIDNYREMQPMCDPDSQF